MKPLELKAQLTDGALKRYTNIYSDVQKQTQRLLLAIDSFVKLYGDDRDIAVFSVPGRSEISGNHTDHNRGRVLAGAIDRDIIAIAAKNDDGVIRFHSEGYPEDTVDLSRTDDPDNFENFTSGALIAGMADAFRKNGYEVGGYDAYSNSEVLKGSGISSSAAYEVMIGNVLNHLYNGGSVSNKQIAEFAQYSENRFFGKPCGLMDQMACAVGGFVAIDFADAASALVEPIEFSLADAGYVLCIVNTGGNHADLNEDYASVPAEMKAVAWEMGKEVLAGVSERELIRVIPNLRGAVGDRAILRAIHFVRENDRVTAAKDALKNKDTDSFFRLVRQSGRSSFQYLQNVYTTVNVKEQGLSLALALTDGFLGDIGAYRVHGGGFAGTIQVFLPKEMLGDYIELIDSVFGSGAAMALNIRPLGAVKLF